MNCLQRLLQTHELVDTHAHLDFEVLADNLELLLQRAEAAGLKEIWLMGVDAQSALVNAKLIVKARASRYPVKLRLAMGLDMELLVPGSELFAAHIFAYSRSQLEDYLEREFSKLTAELERLGVTPELIGEVGMDSYWLGIALEEGQITSTDVRHSLELQQVMFGYFLEKAKEMELPLSIHSRGAEKECLAAAEKAVEATRDTNVAKEVTAQGRGVFHSYTGDLRLIDRIRSAGFQVGLNGICTYKSGAHIMQRVRRDLVRIAENLGIEAETLADIPAKQRLQLLYSAGYVLETDAPYLIPAGSDRKDLKRTYGQSVNDPSGVVATLAAIFS